MGSIWMCDESGNMTQLQNQCEIFMPSTESDKDVSTIDTPANTVVKRFSTPEFIIPAYK